MPGFAARIGRALGDGDVDALVHPSPAVAERRGQGPLTGQIQPPLAPWIGPAGSGRRPGSRSPAGSAAGSGPEDRRRRPRACRCSRCTESSAAAFWSRAAARSASRASSWIRVRSSSAFFGCDLVAVLRHPVDRHPSAVAQRPHAADDRRVLLLDPAQVLVARDEVVEAVGLEHHREQVGARRAVDPDQALTQHVERAAQLRLQLGEALLLAVEAGLDAAQLRDHEGLAVAQRGDLAGELVDLVVVAGRARSRARPSCPAAARARTASGRAPTAGPGPRRRRRPAARARRATRRRGAPPGCVSASCCVRRSASEAFGFEASPDATPLTEAPKLATGPWFSVACRRPCKRYCAAATEPPSSGSVASAAIAAASSRRSRYSLACIREITRRWISAVPSNSW